MKKRNTLAALALALLFSSPLAACNQPAPPLLSDGDESSTESVLPESSVPETVPPVLQTPTEPSPAPEPEPSPPAVTPPVSTTPTVQKASYFKLTGGNVNIRAGAGTDFAVIGSADKGATYAIVGRTGNWYKTYYRGKTGYISASYGAVFELEKTEGGAEAVIEEGYKLLGVPYVYGAVRYHDGNGKLLKGFTAQKFDCSSLVQYLFFKGASVKLGLHTRAQVKQGKFVKKADLKRGDCIFFTNEDRQYNAGVERIGHVAIYLGDDYILHTASDYARIEKMSARRWSFYVEARRFI